MKCDNFTGTLESWEEWSHVFRSSVRAQNIKIVEHIKETEKSTIEITELNMNPMQLRYSAQLYDVLGQFCRGEALSIVRSTPDQMGFSAWQRFYKRYNPKNMATAVRMMQEVIAPGRIKELRDIETATNFWDKGSGNWRSSSRKPCRPKWRSRLPRRCCRRSFRRLSTRRPATTTLTSKSETRSKPS